MRPEPIVGAEACSKWLKYHPLIRWSPIYLLCEAEGYMWMQSTHAGSSLLALKHVKSGVIEMIQDERYAEEDCQRLFVWKEQP
jgi:hypothetical protein